MRQLKPTFISFNVTNRCSQRCPMCRVWQTPAEELALPEMEQIFRDLRRAGFAVMEISGGEPLLRPDIYEIFALLDQTGFWYTTTTNGTLLTPGFVDRLAPLEGLLQLAISLDSLDQERYAYLRGVDSLPKLLLTLDTVASSRLRVPVKLNFTMSVVNYCETLDILRYARERGFYLSVFPVNLGEGFQHRAAEPGLAGSTADRQQMADLFRELARLRRAGEPLWEYSGYYETAAEYVMGRPLTFCDAGRLFFDLHADGGLATCVDLPSYADLRSEPVAHALARIAGERHRIAACRTESGCCYTCTANISVTARHLLQFLGETARVRWRASRRHRTEIRRGEAGTVS
jgi:MoaA/NifB/PqqE/SkfB family radical SAM enzyme